MHRAMSEFEGKAGKQLALSSSQFDPDVWSGRALQVDFAELAVSGLASMYPAFISARAISLTDRPQRAIWVTSVRMRREDRTSISSHPLADLGWKLLIGYVIVCSSYRAFLCSSQGPFLRPGPQSVDRVARRGGQGRPSRVAWGWSRRC